MNKSRVSHSDKITVFDLILKLVTAEIKFKLLEHELYGAGTRAEDWIAGGLNPMVHEFSALLEDLKERADA